MREEIEAIGFRVRASGEGLLRALAWCFNQHRWWASLELVFQSGHLRADLSRLHAHSSSPLGTPFPAQTTTPDVSLPPRFLGSTLPFTLTSLLCFSLPKQVHRARVPGVVIGPQVCRDNRRRRSGRCPDSTHGVGRCALSAKVRFRLTGPSAVQIDRPVRAELARSHPPLTVLPFEAVRCDCLLCTKLYGWGFNETCRGFVDGLRAVARVHICTITTHFELCLWMGSSIYLSTIPAD